VLDIGICGTDKEICSFEYGTPPVGSDYLIIGHEALGEVVEVGAEVKKLKPGDLVVPTVRRPCSDATCRSCKVGHQDFCYTGTFTERGIKEAHGFLTEMIVEQERYLHPVPRELREVAVLVEPLTIAEKAFTQTLWLMQHQHRPPWIQGDMPSEPWGDGISALVLGAGPVGILGAMALVEQGFRTYVYSREQAPDVRVGLVEAIGATYLATEQVPLSQLVERTGNIDLVYEAVGHSAFSLAVLRELGTNGIYILTGVPGIQPLMEGDPATLFRNMVLKNQVVLGTVNAGGEAFSAAIRDLAIFTSRWPEVVRGLIADRYPIEEAPDLIVHRVGGIKSVISFDKAAPASSR
jgi:threonine dehydrogenase-like Zn-dependent dehydrogenase